MTSKHPQVLWLGSSLSIKVAMSIKEEGDPRAGFWSRVEGARALLGPLRFYRTCPLWTLKGRRSDVCMRIYFHLMSILQLFLNEVSILRTITIRGIWEHDACNYSGLSSISTSTIRASTIAFHHREMGMLYSKGPYSHLACMGYMGAPVGRKYRLLTFWTFWGRGLS